MKAKKIIPYVFMIVSLIIINQLIINYNINIVTKNVQKIAYTTEFQNQLNNNELNNK